MSNVPDRFESPKALLDGTLEDLQDFQSRWQAAVNAVSTTKIIQVDPQSGNKTYKVKAAVEIPDRLRYLASNVLSNLRHALDQALCASATAFNVMPLKDVTFPFTTRPEDLIGRLKGDPLKNFPDEIRALLVSFQPYPTGRGYPGGSNLLCDLSKASGPNKHQVTLRVGCNLGRIKADSIKAYNGISIGFPPQWDMANHELIIGTVRPDGHITYNFDFFLEVVFGDAGPLFLAPVMLTLQELAIAVAKITGAIETTTLRLLAARNP